MCTVEEQITVQIKAWWSPVVKHFLVLSSALAIVLVFSLAYSAGIFKGLFSLTSLLLNFKIKKCSQILWEEEFGVNGKKPFLHKDRQGVEQATWRCCAGDIPGDFQVPAGYSHEKPGLKLLPIPLQAGGCTGGFLMRLSNHLIPGSYEPLSSASFKS